MDIVESSYFFIGTTQRGISLAIENGVVTRQIDVKKINKTKHIDILQGNQSKLNI